MHGSWKEPDVDVFAPPLPSLPSPYPQAFSVDITFGLDPHLAK